MKEDITVKFIKKWGDKFDYSDVEYKGYKEKVHIYCKEHHKWFWQTPECHLKFNGCSECTKELKRSLRQKPVNKFIEEAKKVHGDKYDYSKVEYVNNHTKVCIICPEHGEFWQTPESHLKSNGCHECNHLLPNKRIKPFNQALEDFRRVHGNKYQYDKSTYTIGRNKMRIICPEHGEFWQSPNKHLMGRGCPSCWKKKLSEIRKTSHNEFIDRATKKHNEKYDYQNVHFEKLSDKVEIICHQTDENGIEHGPFFQNAASHLLGCGCPKCAQEERTRKQTKTFNDFVQDAEQIHGHGKYLYDEKTYKDRNTDMRIICPIHGEFWQKPNKHLRGHGCPICNTSRLEGEIQVLLDTNNIKYVLRERKLPWLERLELDFYLPEHNVAIECQGIQHFKPVEVFGGEEVLKSTIERDERKKKLCEENGVKLLYFSNLGIEYPYTVFEDKEKILEEILA